ncbi:MAG: PKD domain-containing protein [Ferruginibacter sp.]
MQIIVLDSLHNLITNLTDTICSGQQAIINGNVPTGGNGAYTYQWQQSDDGVTNWTDIPSATNQNYAGTLSASAYFRREVTSLPCQSYGNIIFITVQPSVSNNNINNNQTICINTIPSTITGSMPTGGDGNYSFQWQQSIDSGITWNDIPEEKNKNFAPGILMKTTYYRRNVKTSLCSGPQANISNIDTVSIVPDSKALFSAGNIINCAPFILDTVINVTPFPSGNGQYQWYANGIFLGSNSTGIFPGYTILKADDTVNIKLVTISQYGCKADSIQQQFVTVTTSFANFTKDKSYGCGPLAVQFTNTSNVINGVQFFWDFGNGATSNLSQPGSIIFNTNPFNNDTTYKITLKAYNGCDTTVWLDSVKIRANPRARFGIDTTSGCSPFTVHISNTSFGGPNTYYWNFGNGHLDTTYTTGLINYTYNIGNIVDTFPIRLIAENECKSDTDIIDVRIAPNIIHPQIAINGSDLYSCAPHIIAFNNSTTGATQFTWNFGDGSTDLITNNNQSPVIHTFSNPGVYNIAIQLTNGCSDTTVYTQATVYTKPTASFSTSTSYCIDDTVKVNNNSLNATNYNWFWGDGTNSTDINPTHVYTKAGSYIIYLRAEKTNNAGLVCYDTIIKTVNILAKPPVTIQSNINTINCAPFNLNVTASGITDEKATWYFYDSALTPSLITSTGITGQHVYLKPGIFYVKLVAQNGLGCSDSNTINFTVHGTPVAKISPVNSSICKTDTTIDYSNTSTYNGIDGISYQWLINNSLVSVNANFTYHYTLFPGTLLPFTFNTLLIATNTVGCSDTSQAVLKMNPTAEAMFSITNPNDCVPFNLNITNTSQYTSVYKWLVNDVITSSLPDPVITISNPSTPYTITLIADNVYGCKPDTTLFSFTSRIKPSASFKVSDTLGCTGVLNIATTNTTINASSYTWDWGDATATSTFIAPTHLYSTLGQYLITLTASDGVCNDIANQLVKVSIKPTADFSVNRTIGCDTTTVQFTNLSINASNYLWDFGDGFFDSSVDPIKAYNPSITPYTVKLTAIGNFDCKDSVIKPNLILAKVPPASDFYISPEATISIPDYTFSFTNLTLNSVNYKYLWSLGDSSFAETRDISSHKYSDTGSYPVQLIVLDTITNCTDTTIKIARIDGIPGYLYVPNAFYPNSIKEEFRTFKPVGKGLDSYDFQIFDSWGKLLFESKDIDINGSPVKGWDGTFNGTELPQDAYSWKIVAHFKNGNQWDGMSYGTGANQSRKVTFGTLTLFR